MTLRISGIWQRVQPVVLWLCLIVLLLFTVSVLVLLFPVWIGFALHWQYTERRLLQRLRDGGRLLTSGDLFDRLDGNRGSLLLEAERDSGAIQRVWWLPDRLIKLYPDEPWATIDDLRRVPTDDDAGFEMSQRSREWCEQYVPRLASSAHLVEIVPETMWRWLEEPHRNVPAAAVIPYPTLSYHVKRCRD